MDGRVVQALLHQVVAGHGGAAFDVRGITRAKGNVAGGVLVKQRIEEQHTAPVNGAGCGHEGDLADAVGVLIGGEQLGQQVGVFLRAVLDNDTLHEGDVPAFDELAVVGVGLGAVDDAVGALTVGRAENFLGGNVGDKLNAALGLAGCTLPGGVVGQADGQVGAVGADDVHMVQVPGIQLVAAGFGLGNMLLPGSDGIAGGNAADVKNDLPQLLDGFLHRQLREDFRGPARGGHGGHAPLHAVVHRVLLPGLEEGAAGQADTVQLAGIQPGQGLGILGMDGQRAAAVRVLGVVEVAAQLIGLHGSQVLFIGQLHVQAGELIVLPADNDGLGPGLIARADAGMGEVGHRDRAADDKILARTHIDAHLDDKISVELEVMLVHCEWLLL